MIFLEKITGIKYIWLNKCCFLSNSKFVFPKENATDGVSDNAQKDLPSDGKYEGFADVNDVIITELKNLLSTEDSKGTTDRQCC